MRNKYQKMLKRIVPVLINTDSCFWRAYEWISCVVFIVTIVCVSIFLIGKDSGLAWTLDLCVWSTICIVFIDILKYKITKSSKDKPLRKWFSFRWAQKHKPNEVIILPTGFTGDVAHLKQSHCYRCGALHGFLREGDESERVCSFSGCDELVLFSDEYAECAFKKFRKNEERSTIFLEIRLLPLRFFYRNLWKISEHIFKLFSWMLISSVMLATGQNLENAYIEYAGFSLCVLWIITLFVTCFRAMVFTQDEMIEWSNTDSEFRIMKQVISFIIAMILVLVMMQLIYATLRLFKEVFSNIKLF